VFRTLTIDKGSSSGLRKDMAVIAPSGIVGRILEPPPLYAAKVQLIIDREAAAGAIIARLGVGGVVLPRQLSKDDDRRGSEPELELDYVSNLTDAKVGDRLVTSGLDGIFPRGITIGWLASVKKGRGLYKDLGVNPAVDFSEIGAVLVVLDPPQTIGPSPAGGAAQAQPAPGPTAARPGAATRPATVTPAAAATVPAGATPATPAAKPAAATARPGAPRPAAPRPAQPAGETPAPPPEPPPTSPNPNPNPPGARR
jgi:rod shape-determining protein MreC